ncbi:acylhydrolase [Cellulophaga sp. HaHaR_3_176]|uniref:SGNH/GDSL hydrolase family protein n=1 Tax=Cellulophaga sp. HaHaR_3_176 TaxID=1942464 RepID=UPI001C1FA2D4|nr:SGNH/GDSL hydrolase family protein [Cellulophaga sp. HaHaR_3_176]QWX85393.1 acylhydrolase [Cellulophaga sp. HaHaR_3_176]
MKKLLLKLSTFLLLTTNTMQSQDWPNFNKFKDANTRIGVPAENENRVVFMGNSITEGWINYGNPELFSKNPYINRGISGQTTPQMLVRFRADVIALKPKAVVILAGINDIAENTGPTTLQMIQDNLVSMAELAKANQIKVILSSILPANKFNWNPKIYPADKVIEMNIFIKKYAEENDCIYLDYYTSLVDDKKGMKKEYSDDGVHPTKAGYAVMTSLVEKAIAKALK